MPSLSAHQSNDFVKLLLCGDSGSGKSGALASLVKAGYSLRILDMDNGLDSLKTFVMKDCADKADAVEFRTLRDDYTITATGPVVKKPKAFVDALKMLDNWKYVADDGTVIDYGAPSEWGPDVICVVDSLSFFADAAFDHAKGLNPTAKDPRQWFYSAQQGVESFLAMITSGSFKTNVIVTAHIRYSTGDDGLTKAYPNAIGSALGPTIPRYFNHWAQCVSKAGKRSIQTAATNMMDLKNTKPFEMKATYDISSGLADFFQVLREPPAKIEKPKALTLKRI
jgi:AAA domain